MYHTAASNKGEGRGRRPPSSYMPNTPVGPVLLHTYVRREDHGTTFFVPGCLLRHVPFHLAHDARGVGPPLIGRDGNRRSTVLRIHGRGERLKVHGGGSRNNNDNLLCLQVPTPEYSTWLVRTCILHTYITGLHTHIIYAPPISTLLVLREDCHTCPHCIPIPDCSRRTGVRCESPFRTRICYMPIHPQAGARRQPSCHVSIICRHVLLSAAW
jgi:hypothetical protein